MKLGLPYPTCRSSNSALHCVVPCCACAPVVPPPRLLLMHLQRRMRPPSTTEGSLCTARCRRTCTASWPPCARAAPSCVRSSECQCVMLGFAASGWVCTQSLVCTAQASLCRVRYWQVLSESPRMPILLSHILSAASQRGMTSRSGRATCLSRTRRRQLRGAPGRAMPCSWWATTGRNASSCSRTAGAPSRACRGERPSRRCCISIPACGQLSRLMTGSLALHLPSTAEHASCSRCTSSVYLGFVAFLWPSCFLHPSTQLLQRGHDHGAGPKHGLRLLVVRATKRLRQLHQRCIGIRLYRPRQQGLTRAANDRPLLGLNPACCHHIWAQPSTRGNAPLMLMHIVQQHTIDRPLIFHLHAFATFAMFSTVHVCPAASLQPDHAHDLPYKLASCPLLAFHLHLLSTNASMHSLHIAVPRSFHVNKAVNS